MKRGKPLARKTPMRKRSLKRAAYMASSARTDGVAHMLAVKGLPCVACGAAPPSEAHHLPNPRSDFRVIPLCPFHHRTEYGPQAYHYSRPRFNLTYGSDDELLAKTMEMLQK